MDSSSLAGNRGCFSMRYGRDAYGLALGHRKADSGGK
jgi:hypothetical protein